MSGIRPVSASASTGFGNSPYGAVAAAPGGSAAGHGRDEQKPAVNWQRVLQQLEGDVLEAERALADGRADEIATWGRRADDWVAPAGLGPMPLDLRERAIRLLQHQLAVAEALIERITQSQKQRDVAARMSYGPDRPVPTYIDRAL